MKSRIAPTAALIAVLAVLTACSSTGEVQMSTALTQRIDHGAVASLSVEPHPEVDRTRAVSQAVQRLRGQLFGRLVSEGVFRQVVHQDGQAKYRVQARLLVANEVSQGARIFFGVLAGSNQLEVQVEVFDAGTRALLTAFTAKGTSASHPLSSENDMDDAIREVVDEIVLALQ